MLSVTADSTGAPLILAATVGLEVELFPVLKVQVEQRLLSDDFGNGWYDELLGINDRRSWQGYSDENREELFLTGILPEEACGFASWLGAGARLPTVAELQTVHEEWREFRISSQELLELLRGVLRKGPVWSSVEQLLLNASGKTLADLSLMHGGPFQWVRDDGEWKCIGSPRKEIIGWGSPVRPISAEKRHALFGFRVVRPVSVAN